MKERVVAPDPVSPVHDEYKHNPPQAGHFPAHVWLLHVPDHLGRPDLQFQAKNLPILGLHQTEQLLQVGNQVQVHGSFHHVGAHVHGENGRCCSGGSQETNTFSSFYFAGFGFLRPKKDLLNLFWVKMDMLIFQPCSIICASEALGMTMFMKLYFPKLESDRF